jgi:excisionase family DNA binding protein
MNGSDEMTPVEVGALVGLSPDTVRRLVDNKELIARISPGGHRHIPRAAAEALKFRLENPNALGLGVADDVDRPATGNRERGDEHQGRSANALGLSDFLSPDQAREEGRRYGLELIQERGDARWCRQQDLEIRRWLIEHPEKVGDMSWLVASSSPDWRRPWPPRVQYEALRRVAACIERIEFDGITRGQVRHAVTDVVEDCWNRFFCPECGAEQALRCDTGCGCELCEGR